MKYEKEFNAWFQFMKRWEGGKSNAKTDLASTLTNKEIHTNRGVIFPTWQVVRKLLGKDNGYNSFLNMTENDHKEIAKWLWYQAGADLYDKGVLAIFFAEEYWAGGRGAIMYYQRMLGLTSDGIVGARTANTINTIFSNADSWNLLCQLKRNRYRLIIINNPSQKANEKGWFNRINDFERVFKPTF